MKRMLTVLACATLAACGGGGSSAPTEDPQGFWNGNDFSLLVTPQGELWGVEIASPNYLLYRGTFDASGRSFTAQFTVYGGANSLAATGSGTFVPKGSLTGTVAAAGQSAPFSTTYDGDYDSAPSLAALAGTYTLSSGGTVTIDAAGHLAGAPQGCSTTGVITIDSSGKNFYRLTVTFGPAPCALPLASGSGVLARATTGALVGGVAVGGFGDAFVLTKN